MLKTIHASAGHAQIQELLLEDGALIVEDFLEQTLLQAFNAEIDDLVQQQPVDREFMSPVYDFFFGKKTRHLSALAAHSKIFREQILLHPTYKALCDAILLPRCANYQLNYSHIFEIGPEATRQLFHRDGLCWPELATQPFEIEVASIVALTDFTAGNGATLVVPGSHRWPLDRVPKAAEVFPSVMSKGAALLYLGSTMHAAGANTTAQEWRRGMHVSYCLGWLRTEENNYIATPLEMVREFPRDVQALLGYRAHDAAPTGGCLGVYGMLDPLELLADGRL
ncbi:MAG TPA: phytanoyl-CoA dioxygenase family protein [Spongiibacteraceae bacterium]|nr:phytanoyl-CoA dioxygenase family protein [Spongiibacteraceae bacterium]